ncbi:MAG: hypothetical protein IBV52_00195 [Candidatus Bathyarchaeota archaeon]
MPEKIVYNPKEHVKNQKNAGAKKPTEKPKSTKPTEAKKKNDKDKADEKAHVENGADVKPDKPVTQFKAKLNKYGFIRVPKKARSFLPFEPEKPLIARINGDHLTIAAATK